MTRLAHDCVILGISVDSKTLYDQDDPYYELWLSILRDQVLDTKRQQAEKERQAARGK